MNHLTRAEFDQIINYVIGERLPGRPVQDISDPASTTQNYILGARMQLDDRAFRYAKAGGVLTPDFPAKNALFQHVTYAIVANAVVGAKTVVVTVAATDGVLANGAIATNELAGGYAVLFSAIVNRAQNRRIIANTAVAAPGGAMTVTLDKPLSTALTTVSRIECMASPYLNVQITPPDASYASVVGVPAVAAILNQYLWLQTWGPLWTNADLVVSVGVNNRSIAFGPDGNLHPVVAGDAFNTTQGQHAGFVMVNNNLPARGQGAPFIFLQIAP